MTTHGSHWNLIMQIYQKIFLNPVSVHVLSITGFSWCKIIKQIKTSQFGMKFISFHKKYYQSYMHTKLHKDNFPNWIQKIIAHVLYNGLYVSL